jgi:hypothetical protein
MKITEGTSLGNSIPGFDRRNRTVVPARPDEPGGSQVGSMFMREFGMVQCRADLDINLSIVN